MRNERGEYLNLKDICDNGPAGASGCDKCKYGVLKADDLTGAVPLYLERLVQASNGHLTFCTCAAGQAYRDSLKRRYREVSDQDKRDQRIMTHKVAGSEATLTPENTLRIDGLMEVAQAAIYAALERNKPTMHAEGVKA